MFPWAWRAGLCVPAFYFKGGRIILSSLSLQPRDLATPWNRCLFIIIIIINDHS